MLRYSLYFICMLNFSAILLGDSVHELLHQLSKEKYFPYQDIIVNNQLICPGVGTDCQSRYEVIASIAKEFNRPIKVLDLGANNGYFSFKLAYEFKAFCVMADTSNRLLDLCHYNNQLTSIVYLQKAITLQDLQLLAKQEYFDLVLALNVIHHLEGPCQEIVDTILSLGSIVIIETPCPNDIRMKECPTIPSIYEYATSHQHQELLKIPRVIPHQFDNHETLSAIKEVAHKKTYVPDSYSHMLCFQQPCNHARKQDQTFSKELFKKLNGVYVSDQEIYLS